MILLASALLLRLVKREGEEMEQAPTLIHRGSRWMNRATSRMKIATVERNGIMWTSADTSEEFTIYGSAIMETAEL